MAVQLELLQAKGLNSLESELEVLSWNELFAARHRHVAYQTHTVAKVQVDGERLKGLGLKDFSLSTCLEELSFE